MEPAQEPAIVLTGTNAVTGEPVQESLLQPIADLFDALERNENLELIGCPARLLQPLV